MYVLQHGTEFLADFYGPFDSQVDAWSWVKKEGLEEGDCKLIYVIKPD